MRSRKALLAWRRLTPYDARANSDHIATSGIDSYRRINAHPHELSDMECSMLQTLLATHHPACEFHRIGPSSGQSRAFSK